MTGVQTVAATASFTPVFLKWGGRPFLEIEGKKEAHSTRIPRRRLRFTRWR
jgi:hypothetical protein